MKYALLISAFSLVMNGCSSDSGNSSTPAALSMAHKADACPAFNGKYVNAEDTESSKTFKTETVSDGIRFEDTGVFWTIDGKSHVAKERPQLTYAGGCDNGAIVVNIYEGGKTLLTMTYQGGDKSQMVIETKANDPRAGNNETSVWKLE